MNPRQNPPAAPILDNVGVTLRKQEAVVYRSTIRYRLPVAAAWPPHHERRRGGARLV